MNRTRILMVVAATAALAGAAGMAAVHMAGAQSRGDARTLPPVRVVWEQVPYREPGRNTFAAANFDPRANLPRATVPEVDRTTLPILLPNASTGVERGGLILTSLGDVYDVNLPQSTAGLRVLLSGSRVFVALDTKLPARSKPDIINIGGENVPATIQRTEDGWLSSFSRFGMSYTVEIICDQGPALSYCADSSYVSKVTAGMTEVVLGNAALADRDRNIEK